MPLIGLQVTWNLFISINLIEVKLVHIANILNKVLDGLLACKNNIDILLP